MYPYVPICTHMHLYRYPYVPICTHMYLYVHICTSIGTHMYPLYLLLPIIFNKFILKKHNICHPLLIINYFHPSPKSNPHTPEKPDVTSNTSLTLHTIYTRQFQIIITSVNQGFGVTSIPRLDDISSIMSSN
jgi:hypothetical protein